MEAARRAARWQCKFKDHMIYYIDEVKEKCVYVPQKISQTFYVPLQLFMYPLIFAKLFMYPNQLYLGYINLGYVIYDYINIIYMPNISIGYFNASCVPFILNYFMNQCLCDPFWEP